MIIDHTTPYSIHYIKRCATYKAPGRALILVTDCPVSVFVKTVELLPSTYSEGLQQAGDLCMKELGFLLLFDIDKNFTDNFFLITAKCL